MGEQRKKKQKKIGLNLSLTQAIDPSFSVLIFDIFFLFIYFSHIQTKYMQIDKENAQDGRTQTNLGHRVGTIHKCSLITTCILRRTPSRYVTMYNTKKLA